MTATSASAAPRPRLPLARLVFALSDPRRWRILAELATGEPRSNLDLAEVTGLSHSAASKHLDALRSVGLVVKRHNANFLADHYLPPKGSRELDLGGCVLRFDDLTWLNS